jgi:mRNA interferase HigB
MHVISQKRLRIFWQEYGQAEAALRAWYRVVRTARWMRFMDVRATYPHADLVGKFIVFNVGGNNYRLVTEINFNTHNVFIRHVLTHDEYDKGKWKR